MYKYQIIHGLITRGSSDLETIPYYQYSISHRDEEPSEVYNYLQPTTRMSIGRPVQLHKDTIGKRHAARFRYAKFKYTANDDGGTVMEAPSRYSVGAWNMDQIPVERFVYNRGKVASAST